MVTDSVKSAADLDGVAQREAVTYFRYSRLTGKARDSAMGDFANGFCRGAEWQRQQDESEAMKVAAARLLELEQALEDSAARFRLLDANRSDAAAAMATRAEVAEARLDKVRECVEAEKHYNEGCGWDVPAIRILAILDGEADDH